MKKQDKNIQIEEDLEHQKKSWIFQRAGMVFLTILFILAFLGLGGNGPLSDGTEVSSGGKFKVEYQKITRLSSPIDYSIIMNEDLSVNDTLKIMISKAFLQAIEIKSIMPEPAEETDLNENVEFSFTGGENSHPNLITIKYQFRRYGMMEQSILAGDDKVKINQFVLP